MLLKQIIPKIKDKNLEFKRHSLAHIMALTIKHAYPEAKLA